MSGSRNGSIIAGTWAAMTKIGEDGYVNKVRGILEAQRKITTRLRNEVPEIRVATNDLSSVVAIVTKDKKDVKSGELHINGIALCDVMLKYHNWRCAKLQNPTGFHLAITDANCQEPDEFVDAVKASIALMKEKPELNHNSDVASYGMAAKMPSDCVLHEILIVIMDSILDSL